ncbi:MAG: 50S ribosomal protein L14e [Candidatus Aenigmatarchaeota archaeon]|nr:50S ribosomal protein L14e [Candidatus Aenigmarchaeota archaeon]
MLDIGDVCLKVCGREAGKLCVIIDKVNENYVIISGPKKLTGVRKRKCNIMHLEPIGIKLKIEKNAEDSILEEEIKKIGILDKIKNK